MSDFEKRKKRVAAIWTAAINLVLFLALFLVIAWREPNPPLPEYGVVLNFGLDQQGSGEEEPQESAPAEETPEVDIEEPVESDADQQMEEVLEAPSEEVAEQTLTQPETSPVSAEKTPAKSQPEKQSAESEEVEKVEKPSVNSDALYPGKNQGDKSNTTGNQGDPEGEVDARALYGKAGGGDGAALEMSGWTWDQVPRPEDPSDEAGMIEFEVTIDADGYVVSVITLKKTVSPTVEKIYREEVESLTFSKTSQSAATAPRSKGKITFIIRSN